MLEQALGEHPWVTEARLGVVQEGRAFLGALVALSTEGIHALRNQGRRTVTETLRRHLAGHCETIALPRRWRLLRQLPWSSQGKLPRRWWRTWSRPPSEDGGATGQPRNRR